jgi:ABC-2 type transport system permease protein
MLPLIENEMLKIIRRRRFALVIAILTAVISIVSYAQYRQLAQRDRNWRADVQQRISRYNNILRRQGVNAAWSRSLRAEIARLQYYADHEIDPDRPTAPFFARNFVNVGGFLLLPLLIAMLAADIVSAETAEGTDKLLLTRPVRRWKILLSKAAAIAVLTTLMLLIGGVLAYAIGSIALDPRGWDAPVFTGFQLGSTGVDLSEVRQLPLWQDAILAFGLEWFALLTVAAVALMLSVLFRSSAGSIGTMLAALIAGTILTRVSPDWTAGKYLFVTALPLAAYYSGEPPPYEGMSLTFCIVLLAVWAAAALGVAFARFTRRDVFG